MQSGIRDAQNVAWKLDAVLRGRLPDSLLDSYEPERAPHVQHMTDVAERLGMMIAAKNPTMVFLRNNLSPLLAKTPIMRRLLRRRNPTIYHGFIAGAPTDGSAVGTMIPQPEVSTLVRNADPTRRRLR
jgi:3-(3-hydroxy-phenyl)propionate hydroxylase